MPLRLGGSKFLLAQRKVNVHKPAPLSYTNITDDSLLRRECSGSLMLTLCNVSVVVHVGYADLMRAPTHRNVTSFFPHRAVKKTIFHTAGHAENVERVFGTNDFFDLVTLPNRALYREPQKGGGAPESGCFWRIF